MKTLFVSRLGVEVEKWDVASNEVRAWAYILEADTYCPLMHSFWDVDYLKTYDLIIVERKECTPFIQWAIKQKFPVVVLEEGPLNTHDTNYSDWVEKITTWKAAGCIGVVNGPDEIAFVKQFTDALVVDAQTPYPCVTSDALIVPASERKFVLVPGRSFIFNVAVMHAMPNEQFCTTVLIDDGATTDRIKMLYRRMGVTNVEVRAYEDWQAYVENTLRYAKAAISLDPRQSCNRFAKDCAAFRVPLIGSVDNWTIRDLFASFSVDIYSTVDAVETLKTVLNPDNAGVIKTSMDRAYVRMHDWYDIKPSKDRLLGQLRDAGIIS